MEFMKYLIYTSFILNFACGAWVMLGIVQWVRELSKRD